MPYCHECGEAVPEEGQFCPACGTEIVQVQGTPAGQRQNAPSRGGAGGHPVGRQQASAGGYPQRPTAGARAADHGLLLGIVVAICGLALVEGGAQVLFAPTLVEEAGFGDLLDPGLLRMLGGLVIAGSLVATGLTAYFYRDGTLDRTYFGLLIGLGVFGFMFGGSIVLTLLVLVGIYGFVAVLD